MSHSAKFSICRELNDCFNNPDIPENYMCLRHDELLHYLEIFEKEARLGIVYAISKITYPNNEYLRKTNAPTQCLWLIRSGYVAEVFASKKMELITVIHFPGEFIGNFANYRLKRNNVCALKAIGEVKCLEIPCPKIEEWLQQYDAARHIAEILTENALYWHKNVLTIIKSMPNKEALQYLHDHSPQYDRFFSHIVLASFLGCSNKTIDRNRAN